MKIIFAISFVPVALIPIGLSFGIFGLVSIGCILLGLLAFYVAMKQIAVSRPVIRWGIRMERMFRGTEGK